MADTLITVAERRRSGTAGSQDRHPDPPLVVVVAYLVMLVAWPTGLIAQNTFADGFGGMQRALSDPDVTTRCG